MAATGWRVICKGGGFFDFKSGKLEEDKAGAEELKKCLGEGASICPLGGADAYYETDYEVVRDILTDEYVVKEIPEDAVSDVPPYR